MPLLIDRIETGQYTEGDLLRRVPVFDVTNVGYLTRQIDGLCGYETDADDTVPRLVLDAFPGIAPPYQSYWMEAHAPPTMRSEHVPERAGLLCAWMRPGQTGSAGLTPPYPLREEGDGWTCYWQLWANTSRRKGEPSALGGWWLDIDRYGNLLGLSEFSWGVALADRSPEAQAVAQQIRDTATTAWFPRKTRDRALVGPGADETAIRERLTVAEAQGAEVLRGVVDELLAEADQLAEEADEIRRRQADIAAGRYYLLTAVLPALYAHSLLSCKNVETETVRPPEALSRRHAKRRGHGLTIYRTITIPGQQARTGHGGRIALGDGATALHLVRGHFKTYTPERPLLGRHVGRWYWQMQARGKAEHGQVVKDYRVEPETTP